MASVSAEELIKIYDKYNVLPKDKVPERPSGQCPYMKFDYNIAKASPMYKPSAMNNASTINVYNEMISLKDTMTESSLWSIVNCGLLLRNPLNTQERLSSAINLTGVCEDWETAKPSTVDKVIMTGKIDTQKITVQATQMQINDDAGISAESEGDQACAICFLCAWLFRYVVKQPGEAHSVQITKMAETYLRMYGKSSKILEGFKPSKQWLLDLNNAFSTFSRIRNSIAICVSSMEEYYKEKESKIFNVLRYCYFQNLEFMGMHAYTAIVDIANYLTIPTSLFLTWMRMDRMEAAIDEVAMIMQEYDNGMITNGKSKQRLWKYARLINEGYFNKIQTTYNGLLVSVLAWLRIKTGLAKGEGYSCPLNIQVLSNNKYIRDEGEQIADLIMKATSEVKATMAGSSVIDKMRTGIKRKQEDAQTSHTTKRPRSNTDIPDMSFLGDD